MPNRRFAAVFLLLAAFAGCSPRSARKTAPDAKRWAVLPLANRSNDVRAPALVRAVLQHEMAERGYRVLPLPDVDAAMRRIGVSEGGQLRAYQAVDVAAELKAERLVYGTILIYGFKSGIVLSQRKVELRLRVVDGKTGRLLHEDVRTGIHTAGGVDAVGHVVLNVGGKVVKSVKDGSKKLLPGKKTREVADMTDVIADVELKQETRDAVRKLLKGFPEGLVLSPR